MAENDQEPIEESPEKIEGGNIGNLFSPEAVIMLPLAILIDLIGIILIFVALDDFFITDILGIIIFGGWMFIRSGAKPQKPQRRKITKKPPAGPGRKLFSVAIKELIPYLGAFPWWTITVWNELKS
ncbi:MAG: hypothetical protein AAB565_00275 [Patescibacteria group bacterium]